MTEPMRRTAIIISSILSMALSLSLRAQISEVRGTVKDAEGMPVIGAAVILTGDQSVGVVTDLDGNYHVNLPAGVKNPRLEVSSLGYKTETAEVKSSVLNFVLHEDAEELEETVVVGYGSMRRSDLTGSVTSVKVNEDDAMRSTSVDQLLQGRAAGVRVTNAGGAPDGGVSINIRGMSSFNDTQPLYVIDGVIINSSGSSATLLSDDGNYDEDINGLIGLNPSDIANIEILKDASATAIYGALGANGVILITTKEARTEKPTILLSVGTDISHRYKKMDLMNFDEYVAYLSVLDKNHDVLPYIYEDPYEMTGLKVTPVDWQDYVMRTAVSQRYNVSISGKPSKMSYNLSLGYTNTQGIIKGTEVDRYTARLNISNYLTKNLKVVFKTNIAYVESDMTQSSGSASMSAATSLVRSMLSSRPYMNGVEEEDTGEETDEDEDTSNLAGPDRWMTGYSNKRKELRVTPNVTVDWKIARWLTFRSSLGGDYKGGQQVKFKSARLNSSSVGANGGVSHTEYLSYNFDNMFLVNRKFKGGHTLSGTVGMTMYSSNSSAQVVQGWNIEQYVSKIDAINSAPYRNMTYTESASSTLSYLVRAVYNFRDRYLLTATYRADGSSKFVGNNKWAHFPSFAFAWRVNQEPWFVSRSISSVKLRLGWGRVGNQTVPNYRTFTNYGTSLLPSHSNTETSDGIVTVYPTTIANPALKWETTEQFNVGLDMGFWNGRLSMTLDAYYKVTKDLLQNKRIASANGFTSIWVNEGKISNAGVELSVTAVPVKTKNFEWVIDGNISFNKNRILEINPTAMSEKIFLKADRQTDEYFFYGSNIGTGSIAHNPLNIFIVGQPMGLFYGLKTDGIVQEGEVGVPWSEGAANRAPGSINYVDLNHDKRISDDDRTIIGDPNPDFIYGFSTSLTWKRLTFDMKFVGSYGNDIYNVNALAEDHVYTVKQNHSRKSVNNAWTKENPNDFYPALNQSSYNDRTVISDRYVEDGSYLRISDVSLSYSFYVNKNKNKIFKGLSAGLRVGNPYVWTRYSGWDPDVSSYGSTTTKMGVDAGSYPRSRTYSIDLKFTF